MKKWLKKQFEYVHQSIQELPTWFNKYPKPPEKTQYRICQNGFGFKWLEYKDGWTWKPVPTPYYDKITGREFVGEYQGWYSGGGFEWFVNTYPNIDEYLENVYEPEQKKLEADTESWKKQYNANKEKITYL